VARDTITDLISDETIVMENELITNEVARRIEEALGPNNKIRVRSPLTCETPIGVCAKCYGMDLSRGTLVEDGLAVGIIAAQSIGEPGTQLTMRTFHIGGIAISGVKESEIRAKQAGTLKFLNVDLVKNDDGEEVVLNQKGEILILDDKRRELERFLVPAGATIKVNEGDRVRARQIIVKWDPHNIPILAEKDGEVAFEDIIAGVTMREEKDPQTGYRRKVIMEHKGDLHPQIAIRDELGNILALYTVPEKAHVEVEEGIHVRAGTLIAKTPREITGTQDITGGLPRVTEIFEVRKPANPSVISEVDGVVRLGEKKRGKRTIIVETEAGQEYPHLIPHGKHLRVHNGDAVRAGEPLVDGPLVRQDILRISGEEALQGYLIREVQNVYRAQNVTIDENHVEIIISQMLRKVKVENAGETDFLPGQTVDKFRFRAENERTRAAGKKPATAGPLLLGITKAALFSDSFISAASFQETTKVLTEAALSGKTDELLGLKENVILGHMIPAGTGFKAHHVRKVVKTSPGAPEEAEGVEEAAVAEKG
jgi:DNA-directed RNA polymerase subunit beta'